jgi:SAM-dependent methyltransferase
VPVSSKVIAAARDGSWGLLLTPTIPVPRDWYPDLTGADVLCLASGGGQQGPVLAAAGARVTVYDNSPNQLAQDRMVAERDGLEIKLVEGDMADLSRFPDESFDLIFHPVSNVFTPDVLLVWGEAYRVLRPGGVLLAGISNPVIYIFDYEAMEGNNTLEVKYPLPYSDLESLSPDALGQRIEKGEPLEYSHSLDAQIGGQLKAGFVLTGFYEDEWGEDDIINDYFPTFMATRAVKPPLK